MTKPDTVVYLYDTLYAVRNKLFLTPKKRLDKARIRKLRPVVRGFTVYFKLVKIVFQFKLRSTKKSFRLDGVLTTNYK